ncbi:hypothetical protein APHAL10511_003894 [Amanita phalloides]|nr:hypothetical protein APHAL10511_003894 [Amanita phalloides]
MLDEVVERGRVKHTALTAWFEINEVDPAAGTILYQDFPKKYWYDKTAHAWKARVGKHPPAIGRMYFASPSPGERFYLRMLLTVVAGAKSFNDLKKFNNVLHHTYKAACEARGLLEDDREWNQCLREASHMQTGSALRSLFADRYKEHICDDLRQRLQRLPQFHDHQFVDEKIYDYGLHLLNKIVMSSGKTLADFPNMPLPQGPVDGQAWEDIMDNFLLDQQMDYDPVQQAESVTLNVGRFNEEQTNVFNAVMDSVNNNRGKIIFALCATP